MTRKSIKITLSHLFLVSLIFLSLFLSYYLWFQEKKTPVQSSEPSNTKIVEFKKEMLLPINTIHHKQGKITHLTQNNTLTNLHSQLSQFSLSKRTLTKKVLSKNYFQKFGNNEALEFLYQEEFDLSDYIDTYFQNNGHTTVKPFLFHRILLDFKQKLLIFVAKDEMHITSFKIRGDFDKMKRSISKYKKFEIPLSLGHSILPNHYYFDEPIQLKKYSFLLEQQSHTSIANELLGPTNKEITKNKEPLFIYYENSNHENVQFDQSSSIISFNGLFEKNDKRNIFTSFYFLDKIETFIKNFRYFETCQNKISYRNFINNIPIFKREKNETLTVQFKKTNKTLPSDIQINLDTDALQIPVPQNDTISLPKTADIMQELSQKEGIDISSISDFTIGYVWDETDNPKIADFSPSWFIRYGKEWVPLLKLLGGDI
ncbi:MAG: two-component system activity regulator YycH [Lactobacillales bacterium]|nr:two-component system activity regulator YycH [Lactobacillales bacterium]